MSRVKAIAGRSPRGERGLKSLHEMLKVAPGESLPSRGAWIEIPLCSNMGNSNSSLPSRGAWIEISLCGRNSMRPIVAPLAGSVD